MDTIMAMNEHAKIEPKRGLRATPKGKGIQKSKAIEILEISDDSDAERNARRSQHQRKPVHTSRKANVGLSAELTVQTPSKLAVPVSTPRQHLILASPPNKPATATTRATQRSKPPAIFEEHVIDISSDSDDDVMDPVPDLRPSESPAKRSYLGGDIHGALVLGTSLKQPSPSRSQKRTASRTLTQTSSEPGATLNYKSASGSGTRSRDAMNSVHEGMDTLYNAALSGDPEASIHPSHLTENCSRPPQPILSGSDSLLGIQKDGRSVPACTEDGISTETARHTQNVNFRDTNREVPSDAYRKLSTHYLRLAFPFLPKNVITAALYQHEDLYAPTFLYLHAAEQKYTAISCHEERPYRCNATRYSLTADRRALTQVWDDAFGKEWTWVEETLGRYVALDDYTSMRARHCPSSADAGIGLGRAIAAGVATKKRSSRGMAPPPGPNHGERLSAGKGKQRAVDLEGGVRESVGTIPVHEHSAEADGDIECGCCFAEHPFDSMVQCPDGHLFCSTCVSQYAATQLGAHNPALVCMDASECKLAFPESELRRVLAPNLMQLYSRLISQRAIAAAGLDGLEECPFCDWKCLIDIPVETETLFRCGNVEGGCGALSCRKCKKKDHQPKRCQEIEDHVLNGQHAIEEAMTRALMRNCPNSQCNKAFIKESGCNKMTCPNCGTHSCYVCRKVVTGYGHFGRGGCKLHENVADRHAYEVRAAAKRAAADLKCNNPGIDYDAIKVDLPESPSVQSARRRQEAQRQQYQQQLAVQRRQAQFQALLRRQEHLRQEDLLRQREEAQEEEEEWVHEELAQQQNIAAHARQTALGMPQVNRAPQHGDPAGDHTFTTGPYAQAYAHAFNMLHSG